MVKKKAVLLLSGGLDSTVVAHLIKELGIEIICLHLSGPFCTCNAGCAEKSYSAITAKELGLELINSFMGQEYLDMLLDPKHGYGKNMNPCLACRIFQFKKAKKLMREKNADFILTGEVLGQRPMSQHLKAMKLIEKEAGVEGLVVRPLSAKILDATIPENRGWINREDLLAISGRSRSKQLDLAEKYKLAESDYACPAGGCKLTNKEYSEKVRDIVEYNGNLTVRDVILLNLGRHFRLNKDFKFIVGRDHGENETLEKLADENEIKLHARDYSGPLCLGLGEVTEKNIQKMADVCGFYDDSPKGKETIYEYKYRGKIKKVKSRGITLSEVEKIRI